MLEDDWDDAIKPKVEHQETPKFDDKVSRLAVSTGQLLKNSFCCLEPPILQCIIII